MTQIGGGIAADHVGGFCVMLVVFCLSGLCCLAAPLLVHHGVSTFALAFFCMGLAQGACLPAGNVICSRWLLPCERSWASAMSGMGSAAGSLLLSLAAGPLATAYGW